MDELKKLKEQLQTERPAAWDELPDIELYKDQILGYMPRQNVLDQPEEQLTGAMINNYIKSGLMPRTTGKRYRREHLAYLTAICSLKQVLSVRDLQLLLGQLPVEQMTMPAAYEAYCGLLDERLTAAADALDETMGEDELGVAAMKLAMGSYVQQLVCRRLLGILRERQADASKKQPQQKMEP